MPGGKIELVALTKRFTEVAVDGIDLTVASGEFFSLLGPSGCGKTTTLRLIAGFEQPTSGRIMLDDVDVSAMPPHRRQVNTVFQSYALFPFLTVFENVAFGLKGHKLGKAGLNDRVYKALELVKLRSYEKRRPGQLSGGQQHVYEEPADTYVADFLGTSNLMPVDVIERGPGERCVVRLGESALEVGHGCPDVADHTHAVIRPERVRIEEYGSGGANRVPAMVERLVYLGSSTQVILRLAAGTQLNALLQNDGTGQSLSQGTPVHAYLAPDALRVLVGEGRTAVDADDALQVTGPPVSA